MPDITDIGDGSVRVEFDGGGTVTCGPRDVRLHDVLHKKARLAINEAANEGFLDEGERVAVSAWVDDAAKALADRLACTTGGTK